MPAAFVLRPVSEGALSYGGPTGDGVLALAPAGTALGRSAPPPGGAGYSFPPDWSHISSRHCRIFAEAGPDVRGRTATAPRRRAAARRARPPLPPVAPPPRRPHAARAGPPRTRPSHAPPTRPPRQTRASLRPPPRAS